MEGLELGEKQPATENGSYLLLPRLPSIQELTGSDENKLPSLATRKIIGIY